MSKIQYYGNSTECTIREIVRKVNLELNKIEYLKSKIELQEYMDIKVSRVLFKEEVLERKLKCVVRINYHRNFQREINKEQEICISNIL